MTTGAIILAAGDSQRLGQPKQVVEFQGKTLVEIAAGLAAEAECDPIVVVTGAFAAAVKSAVAATAAQVVHNDRWHLGMGGSIAAGMRFLLKEGPRPDAVLIQVCDQPLIPAGHLKALIGSVAEGKGAIAATRYAGASGGVPACFAANCFADLARLHGETGARSLIRAMHTTLIESAEAAFDLDDPGDLAQLRRRTRNG
jgi:molybdenum cofactor cytidylyltransferase